MRCRDCGHEYLLNFHPHLHVMATDGGFTPEGVAELEYPPWVEGSAPGGGRRWSVASLGACGCRGLIS